MLNKDAIQHIENNAIGKNINLEGLIGIEAIQVMPENYKVQDFEKYLDAPRRFRGVYQTSQINEFISYANEEQAQRTFINTDEPLNMSATASFDLGNMLNPGHNDHRAVLTLKAEPEYREMLSAHGNTLSQKGFAEWLEEHHANITPLAKESVIGAEPEKIAMPTAVLAVRNMEVKSQTDHASKIEDTSESHSLFAQVDMKSAKGRLPTYLDWTCVPFEGLEIPAPQDALNQNHTFRIRVSVVNSEKGVAFALKVLNLSKHQKAIAEAFKTQLKRELTSGTVHIGTFKQ